MPLNKQQLFEVQQRIVEGDLPAQPTQIGIQQVPGLAVVRADGCDGLLQRGEVELGFGQIGASQPLHIRQ